MNQTFDWTRFGKVVRKDLSNIWHHFGPTMLVIALLPMAAWLFMWVLNGIEYTTDIRPEFRMMMIYGVVMLTAMMGPSRLYRTCNLGGEGVYFAMLPASKLEKYISMLLLTVVVCPLLSLFGSVVLDMLFTALPFGPYQQWLWQCDYLTTMYNEVNNSIALGDETAMNISQVFSPCRIALLVIIGHLSTVATYMFTGTIFKKHKVLFTILAMYVIEFALQIVLTPIVGIAAMSGDWIERLMMSAAPVAAFNTFYWVSVAWSIVFTTVLFWWSSYRLKNMRY